MKRLIPLLAASVLLLGLAATPARAHLDGILPLANDDTAALAQARATPGKHVFLYFGDHAN